MLSLLDRPGGCDNVSTHTATSKIIVSDATLV
jgi:hypothetical protein